MGLARSTFYDIPLVSVDGDELLARIGAICDEFEYSATAGSGRRCASKAW